MDSSRNVTTVAVSCILVWMLVGCASSDLAKDRDECADQLIGLATCLPYVGGESKSPTLDCCSGLKQVLQKGKKCLCILVKDRNNPDLGLKINATLALSLPTACHAPSNISECPALLHLQPNSTDAKVFEEFANSTKSYSSTPVLKGNSASVGSRSAEINSDGGKGKRWLGVDMACGLLLWCFTSLIILNA